MGRREGFMTEIQHPIRSSQIKANIQTNEQKTLIWSLKSSLKLDLGMKEVFLCNVVSLKPLKKTERMKQWNKIEEQRQ